MRPRHVNPVQWGQAMGYARHSCARIFREGGSPADALRRFGLARREADQANWAHAVQRIAAALCGKV